MSWQQAYLTFSLALPEQHGPSGQQAPSGQQEAFAVGVDALPAQQD
jgi:hypothetical protein